MKTRVGNPEKGQNFAINRKFLGKTLSKDLKGHLNIGVLLHATYFHPKPFG
jgi:hypothetical protein